MFQVLKPRERDKVCHWSIKILIYKVRFKDIVLFRNTVLYYAVEKFDIDGFYEVNEIW